MIQVATYSGKETKYNGELVEQYSLHDIRSLDEYEITIIDLSSPNIWRCEKDSNATIDIVADFQSIYPMIENREHSKIVIVVPQNLNFLYDYQRHTASYFRKKELKDMLMLLTEKILSKIFQPFLNMRLVYENTKTYVGEYELSASFYFQNLYKVLLQSKKSNKATAIEYDGVILTTLDIDSYASLLSFLNAVELTRKEEEEPKWVSEMHMFDDKLQLGIIAESYKKIEQEEQRINNANAVLAENSKLKSVLYASGDQLVDVVFGIFEELVGCDLSKFVDKKKEDFLFTINGTTFIGEIKGVNHNIKSSNVSQTRTHYYDYIENNSDVCEEKVKPMLVMNHQKNKPLDEREPVMEAQIKLAVRDGILIIETCTLLRILEEYRNGSLSREQIYDYLKDKVGLLQIQN